MECERQKWQVLKRDFIFLWLLCLALRSVAAEEQAKHFDKFQIVSINGAAGQLTVSNETFRLGNSGKNENGVCFALQPFLGSGQIIARIHRSSETKGKVGLVFRESTNSISRFAGMFLSGSNAVFERLLNPKESPITTLVTNANPEWLRVTREGDVFSGFYSTDGTNWIQISADTLEMSEAGFAGFAISGNGGFTIDHLQMIRARLTSPPENSTFTVPTNILLKVDEQSFGGTPRRVEFFSDANKIGEAVTFPFAMTWSNALAGDHSLFAKITEAGAAEFFTEPVSCKISLPAAHAEFAGVDTVTKGDWKSGYGREGYCIVRHATNYPVYAVISSTRHKSVLLTHSDQPEALQLTNGNGGIFAQWFTYTNMTVNVSFRDGHSHQIAFYFQDFDSDLRVQQIEVIDSGTRAVLDTRKISNFHGGKYLLWNVRGAVQFRITALTGNAVINGIFFDPNASSAEPSRE
jgi:hypothetical protein